MKNAVSLFLLTLLCAGAGAAPQYCRYSQSKGAAMVQPLVADDGRIAFLADKTGSASSMGRGGYVVTADAEAEPYCLFVPYVTVINEFYRRALRLTAPDDLSQVWKVSKEASGGAGNVDIVARWAETAEGGTVDKRIATLTKNKEEHVWVLSSSDGSMALIYGSQLWQNAKALAMLCSVGDEGSFAAKPNVLLKADFPQAVDKLRPAFSGDGRVLFFLSAPNPESPADQLLSLQRLDLADSKVSCVAELGMNAEIKAVDGGAWSQEAVLVSTNRDGRVVAFVATDKVNGSYSRQVIKIGVRDELSGSYQLATVSGEEADYCTAPVLSADGRYVAFVSGGSTPAVWRYDRQTESLEQIARGQSSGAVGAVGIAPSGRQVAYVEDKDGETALVRAQFGPALTLPQRLFTLHDGIAECTIEVISVLLGDEEGTVTFTVENAKGGDRIYNAENGEEVQPGTVFAAGELHALRYVADEEPGRRTLAFVLKIGEQVVESASAVVRVQGNLKNLTAQCGLDAEKFNYMNFGFDDDAAVALFRAIATTSSFATMDLKKEQLKWYSLPGQAQVFGGELSGNGRFLYGFDESWKLCRWDCVTGEPELLQAAAEPLAGLAVSADGMVIAVTEKTSRNVMVSTDGGQSFRRTGIVSGGSGLFLTPDGRMLGCVNSDMQLVAYHPSDADEDGSEILLENTSELYGMSHDGASFLVASNLNGGRLLLWNRAGSRIDLGEFSRNNKDNAVMADNGRVIFRCQNNQIARMVLGGEAESADLRIIAPAKEPMAVSGSGRMMLMTSADLTLDSAAEELADCPEALYLYRDPSLVNAAPYFNVTDYTVKEGEAWSRTLANLVTDIEQDRLCIRSVSEPANGTLAVREPRGSGLYQNSQYTLVYTPKEHFCGEDSFTVSVWDGEKSAVGNFSITVENVNDPPVWVEEECTQSVVLNAGENGTAVVVASDPDCENPEKWRDTLVYGVGADTPQWCVINSATGEITLRPGLDIEPGRYSIVVTCTDGHIGTPIERTLPVTVNPAAPVAVSLQSLLGIGGGSSASGSLAENASAVERWSAAVAGCWAHLLAAGNTGWQLLSLPGNVRAGDAAAALGSDKLWLDRNGAQTVCLPDEEIAGGTAFWAKVNLADDVSGIVLTVTPSGRRAEVAPGGFHLLGPLVDEEVPESRQLWIIRNGTWIRDSNASEWRPGRGLYYYCPAE